MKYEIKKTGENVLIIIMNKNKQYIVKYIGKFSSCVFTNVNFEESFVRDVLKLLH